MDRLGRLLDGSRKNVRLVLLALLLTVIGIIGLLVSFDPGQADQRLRSAAALLGGLGCWVVLYLLGSNDPWSGDEPNR